MSLEQLKREMYARFKENAQLIENPIEHGDNSVDGSFYQIYRGNLESFLEDFAAKAYLQGIRDAKGCVGEKKWISIEHQKFLEEVGELKETRAEVRGMNMRRSETLEAITRLEEGTDV